jgi:hypothetical protein
MDINQPCSNSFTQLVAGSPNPRRVTIRFCLQSPYRTQISTHGASSLCSQTWTSTFQLRLNPNAASHPSLEDDGRKNGPNRRLVAGICHIPIKMKLAHMRRHTDEQFEPIFQHLIEMYTRRYSSLDQSNLCSRPIRPDRDLNRDSSCASIWNDAAAAECMPWNILRAPGTL